MNKSFLFVIMMISTSFTGCIDTGEESDFTEQIKNLEDKIEALEKEIENLESEKSNETIEDLEIEIENLESETSNLTQVLGDSGISGVTACLQGLVTAESAGYDIGNSLEVVIRNDVLSMNKTVDFGLEIGDDAATICAKVLQSKYGMVFSGWNSESGISFMEEGNYASTSIDFDERALLGSWRSPMKHTNNSIQNLGNCVQNGSWLRTDANLMMEMMENTGQNTYITHISGNVGGCEWLSLKDLLSSAGESEPKNVWMGLKDNLNLTQYSEIMREYALLDTEPHVGKAVVIDDFHQKLHTPWFYQEDKLYTTHLEIMRNSLEAGNRKIDFIPYVSAHHSMMHVLPSVVLGVGTCWNNCYDNNSFVFETDDIVSATWNFDLEFYEAQNGVRFESFLYDTLDKRFSDRDLHLVFEFDGVEVERRSLMNDEDEKDGIFKLEIELPSTYAGKHNLTVSLQAIDKAITKTHSKMVFISDPKITMSGETLFKLNEDSTEFKKIRQTSQSSSDYLFATNNWWRITDFIDGMMFKWMNHIDSDTFKVHEEFIEWACSSLDTPRLDYIEVSNKKCIEVYWGDQQWTGYDGHTAEDYLHFYQATANHTDGLIVWRLDNQRYDMDSGIYAEKRTSNADAPFVSMYPSHTPATEGWYQQWNFSVVEDGFLNLTINDLVHKQYYDRMFVIVEVNDLESYRYDVAGPQSSDLISLNVSSGDLITLRFETYASFGSVIWYVEIDGTLNDVIIERNIATYHSGSSKFNEFMFEFTTNAFRGDDLADFII